MNNQQRRLVSSRRPRWALLNIHKRVNGSLTEVVNKIVRQRQIDILRLGKNTYYCGTRLFFMTSVFKFQMSDFLGNFLHRCYKIVKKLPCLNLGLRFTPVYARGSVKRNRKCGRLSRLMWLQWPLSSSKLQCSSADSIQFYLSNSIKPCISSLSNDVCLYVLGGFNGKFGCRRGQRDSTRIERKKGNFTSII